MDYNFREIEKKWKNFWEENDSFEPLPQKKEKKYILSMFPYPSGRIHMGHVRNYAIGDALARYYRKKDVNVLHPIGWDAFGMPAENAAIKSGIHPKKWTYSNIETMKKELKSLGFSFAWKREFATCQEDYTKFEQEFIIKMWEKGLLYRKKAPVNWCPKDKTVLANEQVIEGKCWRCDTEVVQKELQQYFLKITDYAQELLEDLEKLKGSWPSQVLSMQKNWIGRSDGLEFWMEISTKRNLKTKKIEVFTTRADTIYGITYCALAPEHPLTKEIVEKNLLSKEKIKNIKKMQNTPPKKRMQAEKEGVFLEIYAIHPLTGEKIPVYCANFVLMEYGTGAVMSVPAHDERDFEFAKKYSLPIKWVIKPKNAKLDTSKAFIEDGILTKSEIFSNLSSKRSEGKNHQLL
jgi:leucyl-tRNA synthetase